MKRISKRTKICCSMVLLLAITLFIICTRNKTMSIIEAPAFFSERKIELSLAAISYAPDIETVQFETRKPLEEIKKSVLKWDSEAQVEIQDNSMFISSENPKTGQPDYYYLYKSFLEEDTYIINDFSTRYENMENDEFYYLDFLVPMHLLCYEDNKSPSDFKYGRGERYEMISGATLDDVYNFYYNSGYYDILFKEGQIILCETFFLNPKGLDGDTINYEINYPVTMEVTEENEKFFFSCTVENRTLDDILLDENMPIDSQYDEEEKLLAITMEEALEQMLSIGKKSIGEIKSTEVLYNIRGESSYQLLIFSSGGYMIHMLDYPAVMEFSENDERKNPYESAMDKKKYYAGPGNYLYEENSHIFGIQREPVEVQLDDFEKDEERLLEYAKHSGKRIIRNEDMPESENDNSDITDVDIEEDE